MGSNNTALVDLETPSVEERCVCIATEAGLPLAAMISSYFNSPGRYFAVFEFPTLAFPYTGASDERSDGYFAQILGDKAAGEINHLSGTTVKVSEKAGEMLDKLVPDWRDDADCRRPAGRTQGHRLGRD